MPQTDTLLAERELPGYPGTRVELRVWDEDSMTVEITDPAGSRTWGPTASRYIAKDWYFHPFVFGYDYPSEAIVEDDGA